MGQGGVQVGDMHPDQRGDMGGAGGLAQLPGPHRGAGVAPQVGGHASPRRCPQLARVDPGRGGGPLGGLLPRMDLLALAAAHGDPLGWGRPTQDGVLVPDCQRHLQAGVFDRAGSADGLGGLLGGLVAGLGVEQLQVVLAAGGAVQDLGIEGGTEGQAGEADVQRGGIVALQAGQQPGLPVDDKGHAASPPRSSDGSGRKGPGNPEGLPRPGGWPRRARSAASSRRYSA
jgi:hypothetical protein